MRREKKGNIIYLRPKRPDTLDLQCTMCGVVKNEDDIKTIEGNYECECGSHMFTVMCDIEEL